MKAKTTSDERLLCCMIAVNILIPKCGIKYKEIPVTLGSVLLLFCLFRQIQVILPTLKMQIPISVETNAVIAGVLFWGGRTLLVTLWIGEDGYLSYFRDYLVYLTSLIMYSSSFFLIVKIIQRKAQIRNIIKIIYFCEIAVLIYALVQWRWGIGNTAVPGITVNLSDYMASPHHWWLLKSNQFSGINSKIVSTYQNGNILGANMLLIFPAVLSPPPLGKNSIFFG